jgi:hypothetical protein
MAVIKINLGGMRVIFNNLGVSDGQLKGHMDNRGRMVLID